MCFYKWLFHIPGSRHQQILELFILDYIIAVTFTYMYRRWSSTSGCSSHWIPKYAPNTQSVYITQVYALVTSVIRVLIGYSWKQSRINAKLSVQRKFEGVYSWYLQTFLRFWKYAPKHPPNIYPHSAPLRDTDLQILASYDLLLVLLSLQ